MLLAQPQLLHEIDKPLPAGRNSMLWVLQCGHVALKSAPQPMHVKKVPYGSDCNLRKPLHREHRVVESILAFPSLLETVRTR